MEFASPLDQSGSSEHLAIFLHGCDKSSANMLPAIEALRNAPGGVDIDVLKPDLPFTHFSRDRPSDVLVALISLMDRTWKEKQDAGRPYQSVLFVGHSMGSLYARKAYAAATGEKEAVKTIMIVGYLWLIWTLLLKRRWALRRLRVGFAPVA